MYDNGTPESKMSRPPSQSSPPASPSLSWRFGSSLIMGLAASASRTFLFGLNKTETIGLEGFLETLDRREDVNGRERGLITGK